MRRQRIFSWLSILLLITAGIVAWIPFKSYRLQDLLHLRPFGSYLLTGNSSVSSVSSNATHLFVTVQKKAVYVLEPNQTVDSVVRIQDGPNHRINDIDGVTADTAGNMYILVTTLDPQGLFVLYETIDEYGKNGQFTRQVYRKAPPSPMYREGDIRGLHAVGDSLWFDNIGHSDVQIDQLNPATKQAKVMATYQLPPTLQVATASTAGNASSPTYITTLTGDVYQGSSNQVQPLYTAPSTGGMASKFPLASPDGKGVDIFDAYHPNLVRIPNGGGAVQNLMTQAMASKATHGAIDLADFQGWTTMGQTVVAATSDHIWKFTPDGTVFNTSSQFPISKTVLHAKELFLAALMVMVLCLLYWLIYLHRYVTTKRRPLLVMSLLVFVPAFAIAMVLLNVVVNHVVTNLDKNNSVSELHLLAHQGQLLVNGDALQSLSGPSSVHSKAYHNLLNSLNTIYQDKSSEYAFYNTLYQYKNNQLYIVHDDDSKVQPFTEFPIAWNSVQDNAVLHGGQILADVNPAQTPQGYWLYALAPVYNSQHQVVGIYETGMDESVILNRNHILFMRLAEPLAGIFLAIFLLVIFANLWLTRLIRKLRLGAMDIANGNWGLTVNIHSKNEIEDLAVTFNAMSRRLRETFNQIRGLSQLYYRFVPDKFIQFIGRETISDVQLGDQAEREMNILVCNIRDFYQLSNAHSTKQLFDMINVFLGDVGPIIGESGVDGFISRYLGSGFIALIPEKSEQAIHAGVEISKRMRNQKQLSVGIGLHYGSVMFGVLGDAARWEGSVLSEDVNLAQLVEESTSQLGATMLVTEHVLKRMPTGQIEAYRDLGNIYFAPLGKSVHLYDALYAEDDAMRQLKLATKSIFEEGVAWFQDAKFHLAREAFVQVIHQNPEDEAARLYFYAADEWRYKGVGNDWTGSLTLVDLADGL